MATLILSYKNYKSLPAKVASRLGVEVRSGMVRQSEIDQFQTRIYSITDSEFIVVETHDRMLDEKSYTMYANMASFEQLQRDINKAPKFQKNRAYKGWSKNLKLPTTY